ncbi:hypothetical protein ESZ36_20660 [Colwellia demingiae]|uniref:Tetratricopeptide repeat protein n=1 Tax=Colwellia demingiae TaxID=89401 RepID=A0A5C6Q5J7_9GAMM|nr:hypothetical protein [Colwellia demingiae]TWX64088.1 hypothetical protein ESZ36_20660 [Colwellia demingiae]
MNMIIKSTLIVVTAITSNFSLANNISPDFLLNEIDISYKKYVYSSLEVGIYAMESVIRLQESDRSSELLHKTGPASLALSYLRLGLLYEKLGLNKDADKVFYKAVTSYKSQVTDSENVSLIELKKFVVGIDASIAANKNSNKDT